MVETLVDVPGTTIEMTYGRLIFVAIGAKVEKFSLIWGMYARFVKKMTDSSSTGVLPRRHWWKDRQIR